MERLRNMGLRRSFFLLSAGCLAAALLLTAAIYSVCDRIGRGIPRGGIAIAYDGVVTELEEPSPEQLHVLRILGWVQTLTVLLFPVSGLGIAGVLFYRWKLKEPIRILKEGTERIRMQDLDFSIPVVSADELGGICAAFEIMRLEQMPVRRKAVDGALLRQELEETAELLACPPRTACGFAKQEREFLSVPLARYNTDNFSKCQKWTQKNRKPFLDFLSWCAVLCSGGYSVFSWL